MKQRKIDSQVERRILTAMIISTEFLNQAVPVIDLELIDNPPFRLILQWCLEYFAKYREAPRRNIETTYHAWVESQPDAREADSIHDLLEQLSEDYDDEDPLNVPYLLDKLQEYLQRKSLEKLKDNVDYALQAGHADEGEQTVLSYKPIEICAGLGIDPLHDFDAWERAFADSAKPLFTFPGDAGRFLNSALTHDGLIGLQGPEKRGKTFWCIEFVARALEERRKVAFFQVGDLSQHQVLIRLGMYWAGRPFFRKYCGDISYPIEVHKPTRREGDAEGSCGELRVETRTKHCPNPLTLQACKSACERLMKAKGLSPNKCYIKLSVHPNSSINVRGIDSILTRWEMTEGFVPEVIVIDYADILAAEDPRQAVRDQVNETWKALRRLSQERHCLVISPTQADADSYDRQTMTMRNFSEDKRKLAHVTGMLGLNQTPEEKALNVMRLNWIVLRESPFNVQHCLYVGQCLSIGRAFFCATL